MFSFFKRRAKEVETEEQEQQNAAGSSGKKRKNVKRVDQYVVERLEQIIEITRDIEETKAEYRKVTSYLNDIKVLEGLPEEEKKKIQETAASVMQLNTARTEFLNASKKLSDARFAQFEQEESEIPAAIKRLHSNEMYRDTVEKDMKYVEREKSEWVLRKEYLGHQQIRLKNLLYILIGIAVTTAIILVILQFALKVDCYYAWMILVFVTAVVVCIVYIRIQDDGMEITAAERNLNRSIVLMNKVKIRYVNIVNAVDYACEKYHVQNAEELNRYWEYYMEAVKEREKFQRANEDLEYFNGRLIRQLSNYELHDSKVWLTQANALVDPKEMVEIKHVLVNRRQKLREHMEYNLKAIRGLRNDVGRFVTRVGDMQTQVEEILASVDRLLEGR